LWNLLAEMFAGRESDVARGMQAVLPTPNPNAPTLGQALLGNIAALTGPPAVTPMPTPTPAARAPYTQMEYAQRMAAQAAAAQAAAREQAAAQAAAAQQQALLSDLMRKRMAAGRGYLR